MGDIKLLILDFFFYINFNCYEFFFYLINALDPFLQNGFSLSYSKFFYFFNQNMSFFFSIKFCLCIAFLILIRGGAPRYRYDYLTKLGWLKFLGLVLTVFLFSLFIFSIY